MPVFCTQIEIGATTKVFRFNPATTVAEACQEIRERSGEGDDTYGLFQKQTKAASKDQVRSRWLAADKGMGSFSLVDGDTLTFQSTNRNVKVTLPDGGTKTVVIDDSALVEKIIDHIGLKMNLTNAEEYGLSMINPASKKKLWLQGRFTLYEQLVVVKPETQLSFEKRFFMDDYNVDKGDPTQLNFVYTQSSGRVRDGTYPCKADEAVQLAAVELQVEVGNFVPAHHNEAYVRGKGVLPKQFQGKNLEGAVLKEWAKMVNTTTINAKYKYVTTVRQLPTFGITLWTVREKVPKKRKLQEVLLGLTRDAVVRIDKETKVVLSSFPLKHVRRWAAGTNSFTLDYGQYKNEYYTVQCGGEEAEDISNTLAGYIDILLKRQREGRIQMEVDEGELAKVEELAPVAAVPNMCNLLIQGVGKYNPEDFRSLDLMPGLNLLNKGKAAPLPGNMVISDWGDAARRINQLTNDTPNETDEYDDDPSPVELKWNLLGHCANVGGAVTDMLNHNPTTSAQNIVDQLADLLKAAQLAANSTQDISLLEAAKKVSLAVADVLKTAHDLDNDPESVPLKHRLQRAGDALKGTSALMAQAIQADLVDQPSTQLILEASQQAAQALKAFCEQAGESVALRSAAPDIEQLLAASRAFAAGKADQDNINLLEAARRVAKEVEDVLSTSRKDDPKQQAMAPDLQALLAAANAFARAPSKDENINLLSAVQKVSKEVQSLLSTTHKVDEAMAMVEALVEKSKILAPLLMDPQALDQFRLETDRVKKAAQAAFQDAKRLITDPVELQQLMDKAKQCNSALVQMLNAAEVATGRAAKDQEEIQTAVASLIAPLETIKFSGGDTAKVVEAVNSTKKSVPHLINAVKHQAMAEPSRTQELLEKAKAVAEAVQLLHTQCAAMKKAEEEDRQRDEPAPKIPEPARALLPDLEALLSAARAKAKADTESGDLSLLEAVRNVNSKVKQLLHTTREQDLGDKLVGPLRTLEEVCDMEEDASPVELAAAARKAVLALHDPFQAVLSATKQVNSATKDLLGEDGEKFALFNVVRLKAKQAVASTLALANVSTSMEKEVENDDKRQELHTQTRDVHDVARRLVKELATASQDPGNWEAQAELVKASRELAKPFANMVNSARGCIPAVSSVATKQTLRYATAEASEAIVELVNACRAAGAVTGIQDVDEANQAILRAQLELDHAMAGKVAKTLSPEEARAEMERQLAGVMNAVGGLSNPNSTKDLSKAAKDATSAVLGLVDASKALSAADGSANAMEGARDLLPEIAALIAASKDHAANHTPDTEISLTEAVARVNANVKTVLLTNSTTSDEAAAEHKAREERIAQGEQSMRMVQESLRELKASRAAVTTVASGAELTAMSADLEKRTAALEQAADRVCELAQESKAKPEELDAAIQCAAAAFPAVVTSVNKIVSSVKSPQAKQGMIQSTQLLGGQLGKILTNAEAARMDPKAREALEEARSGISAAGRDLQKTTRGAMPGLQDLEKALKLLDDSLAVDAVVPPGDHSVRSLPAATERLGDAAVAIIRAARVEPDELGAQSVQLARCLSDILDVARGFNSVSQSFSCAVPVKQALARLRTAEGKTVEVETKRLMAAVPKVMEVAKTASGECGADDSEAIKSAAKLVKPSLTALVTAAKGAKGAQGLANLREAVDAFDQCFADLMSAVPNGGAQASRLMSGVALLVIPTEGMIQTARGLADAPGDAVLLEELTAHGKSLGKGVRAFREVTKGMTPGTLECEAALKDILASIDRLDESSMDAAVGILDIVPQHSHQVAQERMVDVAKQLAQNIQLVVEAIKGGDFDGVAKMASGVSSSIAHLADGSLQLAATTSNQDIQIHNLTLAKSVADSTQLFMRALSELTVDRTSAQCKRDLGTGATEIRNSIQTLMRSLRDGVVGLRACDEALELIASCRSKLDAKVTRVKGAAYGECQAQLIEQARSMISDGTQLFQVAKTEPQAVGDPCKSLADCVVSMTEAAIRAAGAADEKGVQKMLMVSTQTVCDASENFVSASKRIATDPENDLNIQALSQAFQDLSDRVTGLIRSLKEGATGERDCREAAGQLRKAAVDLDSAAVTAATGGFRSDAKQSLAAVHGAAVSSVRALLEQAKAVRVAVDESQTALGLAARALAQSFLGFSANAKQLAGQVTDVALQSDSLLLGKVMGTQASGLVMAALQAQSKASDKKGLEERVAALTQNVSDYLAALALLDEAVAGVQAATQAKNALEKKLADSEQSSASNIAPKDLAKMLPSLRRIIAIVDEFFLGCTSTAGADFVENVTEFGTQAQEFLRATGASPIKREAHDLLADVVRMLEHSVVQAKDSDKYQDVLVQLTESIGKRVDRVLVAARRLPGAGDLELEESSELEQMASNEMLAAAASIQQAADLLMSADADEGVEINIDDDLAGSILTRARAITEATMELMKGAISAQTELNKKGGSFLKDDSAQGLVSSAKLTALCVQDLVSAANAVAKGQMQEDAIIAVARTVGASTARLMASTKAKLEPSSPFQATLVSASNKINHETKELTREAQKAIEEELLLEEQAKASKAFSSAFAARAAKLEGAEEVNALQRQLDNAYRKLKLARQKDLEDQQRKLVAQQGKATSSSAPSGRTARAQTVRSSQMTK